MARSWTFQPHKYDPDGHTITYRSADGEYGLRFETSRGQVKAIQSGPWEHLHYVEGCGYASLSAGDAERGKPRSRPTGRAATEDFKVPASDAGIQLHLHNKHAAVAGPDLRRHVVLFVHGATFPGEQYLRCRAAGSRFDACQLDGRTRPPGLRRVCARYPRLWGLDAAAAMSQPPEANAPSRARPTRYATSARPSISSSRAACPGESR